MLKLSWSMALVLGFIVLIATKALAAPSSENLKKEDQKVYSLATQVFSTLKTAGDIENLFRATASDSQKSEVESWLQTHTLGRPGKAAVSEHGFQLNFGGNVETIRMVDSHPGYFFLRGVEVDLRNSRSLAERFNQVESILSTRRGAHQLLMPTAREMASLNRFMSFDRALAAETRKSVSSDTTNIVAAGSSIELAKVEVDLAKIYDLLRESKSNCFNIKKDVRRQSASESAGHTSALSPVGQEVVQTVDSLYQKYCGDKHHQMLQNLKSIKYLFKTSPSQICDAASGLKKDCTDILKIANTDVSAEQWKKISGPLASLPSDLPDDEAPGKNPTTPGAGSRAQ